MHALTLLVPADAVDAVCDELSDELAALSASVEDADAGSDAERPVFDEPGVAAAPAWRLARVDALFADDVAAMAAAAAIAAAHGEEGVRVVAIDVVADHDWVRLTQAQFGASEIVPGFWIVPTWAAVPETARQVIRLDPGRAFGTGTHATTRLCLRWIAAHGGMPGGAQGGMRDADQGAAWPRMLDYGCGSGVLAIAARLFGAGTADAVDIDAAAVDVADANARANGVELRTGLPESAVGPYPLIVANILAAPLKLLAPVLAGLLEADGTLVLSGVLERQADELRTAYAPWLALAVAGRDEGWILLEGTRPREPRMA